MYELKKNNRVLGRAISVFLCALVITKTIGLIPWYLLLGSVKVRLKALFLFMKPDSVFKLYTMSGPKYPSFNKNISHGYEIPTCVQLFSN